MALKRKSEKNEVCPFHLNNRQAKDKIEVEFDGIRVNHIFFPKCLGNTGLCAHIK